MKVLFFYPLAEACFSWREKFVSFPSTPVSCRNGTIAYVQNSSPLGQASGLSVMSNHYISPCVPLLVFPCSPSTVLFIVPIFIVNSIKRVIGCGSRPHVSVEVFKLIPTEVHLYTSSSILRVLYMHLVSTALQHTIPSGILSGIAHVVRHSGVHDIHKSSDLFMSVPQNFLNVFTFRGISLKS